MHMQQHIIMLSFLKIPSVMSNRSFLFSMGLFS